ncbi:MAG: hypothetical protein ACRDK7_11215 [Solirubrobacteraceae bacterium]
MPTLRTLPSRRDTTVPATRPPGRWARARHAATELTPDAIEQVAQRVAQLLRHEQPPPAGAPQDTHPTGDQLLTAWQLAKRLGLTRAWVYEHANELGAIPIGDGPKPRLRFDPEVAKQALQARNRRREPEPMQTKGPRPGRPRRHPAASTVPLLPVHEPRSRGIFARWQRTHRRNG